MKNSYNKRYIANIVFEANTPLKVGSSDIDMLQDSPVQKDWNEFPMVLGTSIAGVLRKEFDKEFADDIFGDEQSRKKENRGSRLIISNALLCDRDMQVIETLQTDKNDFLKIFDTLPVREHTAITDKGVAKDNSKFDEEVVYKGSRFRFRMELIAYESDAQNWKRLIEVINSSIFRLGGGTTKGFGDIKILHNLSTYDIFDLGSKEYQENSSSLNTSYTKAFPTAKRAQSSYTTYTLKIKPEDFFLFGSSFGDDDADATPVYEQEVVYDEKTPKNSGLSGKKILLPASSIKGALAHRTTFHYNSLVGNTIEAKNGINSIEAIFGSTKDSDSDSGQKGKVIFSDCYEDIKNETKVFDHVSIDRFTGGAKDGALFQEKTIAQRDLWKIEILLHKNVQGDKLKAFEMALSDITIGMLPLGGMTTKGHGVFCGELLRDGEKI